MSKAKNKRPSDHVVWEKERVRVNIISHHSVISFYNKKFFFFWSIEVFFPSHVICPQIHIFEHFIKYPACNLPLYASEQPNTYILKTHTWLTTWSASPVKSAREQSPCGSHGYCYVMCRQPLRGGCRIPASSMPLPFTSTDFTAKFSALKRE